MLFVTAMRDFADGLARGFGLYLTERDALSLGRGRPAKASQGR